METGKGERGVKEDGERERKVRRARAASSTVGIMRCNLPPFSYRSVSSL